MLGAWQYREQALTQLMDPRNSLIERLNGRAPDVPAAGTKFGGRRRRAPEQDTTPYEDFDPRGEW